MQSIYFLQKAFEPKIAKKIIGTWKNDQAKNKFYQGDKWYQKQKGAKWYLRKKKPMEKEPKK